MNETEKPHVPVKKKQLLVAGNYRVYQQYLKSYNIHWTDALYIASPTNLRGLTKEWCDLIMTCEYRDRLNPEFEELIKLAGFEPQYIPCTPTCKNLDVR